MHYDTNQIINYCNIVIQGTKIQYRTRKITTYIYPIHGRNQKKLRTPKFLLI